MDSTDLMTAYVAHLIATAVAAGESQVSLARRAGVSQGMISQLKSGKTAKGVGLKSVDGFARAFGRTVPQFHEDAAAWASSTPGAVRARTRTIELDTRYPNREAAIRSHVELGAAPADARRWADAAMVAAESESDLPPRAWFLAIEDERRRELSGMGAAGRAATDDDLEPPRATPTTRRRKP